MRCTVVTTRSVSGASENLSVLSAGSVITLIGVGSAYLWSLWALFFGNAGQPAAELGLEAVAGIARRKKVPILVDCAAEGARYAALADRSPQDGAARTRALIGLSLAPGYAGRWSDNSDLRGWYEFRIAQDGKLAVVLPTGGPALTAPVTAKESGGEMVYEIALPWTSLPAIKPAVGGSFRLALLARNVRQGLFSGKASHEGFLQHSISRGFARLFERWIMAPSCSRVHNGWNVFCHQAIQCKRSIR